MLLPETRTLIDDVLAEQQQLTAVEAFSRAHDREEGPSLHTSYRNLIPLSVPPAGHQYAFEVDLDKCTGCKACVTACHALNGLDDAEAWRRVGTLITDDWRAPYQQSVTTACHHCVDPACLNGCPVLAYDKDPLTGIVRHLDDQCIGCQYCVMMCPYEVPQYSPTRGIVRKCDMCSQRLEAHEAPACAQACPNEAIRITIVQKDSRLIVGSEWLPAAPPPHITLPTTRYVWEKAMPARVMPSEAAEVRLQPAHWPLIWMLVFTQFASGALLGAAAFPQANTLGKLGFATIVIGTIASVGHLGKPSKAWRAFLGLKRSWLSREIVLFGSAMPIAFGAIVFEAVLWKYLAALAAILGVFCSAMIYHDTRRIGWRAARTLSRFFGTTLVLGLAVAWVSDAFSGAHNVLAPVLLMVATSCKLAFEHRLLRHGDSDVADQTWPSNADFDAWSLARSGLIMRHDLGLISRSRFFLGIAGGIVSPTVSLLPGVDTLLAAATCLVLCFIGEVAERYQFFRAVVPPHMPGAA